MWPASTQTLDRALAQVNLKATGLKQFLQTVVSDSSAGPILRSRVLEVMRTLASDIALWNAAAALPGMVEYAQTQLGNPTLDVTAEFTSMRNAAQSLLDWIFANFPKDAGSGAVLLSQLNADGTLTDLQFTTAQLAEFRTRANAVIATIG